MRNLFSAGNAHSARYGELIHDRTRKPVSVYYQEQAYFENFVMGSDAADFFEQSQRPSAKPDRKECRTFNSMVNVHGYDV